MYYVLQKWDFSGKTKLNSMKIIGKCHKIIIEENIQQIYEISLF